VRFTTSGLPIRLRMVGQLKLNPVPCSRNKSCQNYFFDKLAKFTTESQISITQCMPGNLLMLSKKTWATLMAESGCLSGMKCAYLENLSTITKVTDLPGDVGRPSTKSIEMLV
jgi:hypothetical protein